VTASPGQRIRQLDPLRRVAILLIGAAAAMVVDGPVYATACGSYLRNGETGEGFLFCQLIPTLVGIPIAAVVAGAIGGLIGRGMVDYLLLLFGVAVGGEVAGALLGGSGGSGLVVVLIAIIPLTVAYVVVWGVRRVRGPAMIPPALIAALTLGCAVVSVASGAVAAQLPRTWGPWTKSAGLATVRLDNPAATTFSGRVTCTFVSGPDRFTEIYGESLDWPAEGLTVSVSLDDRPGWEPSIRIDLPHPGPVESGAIDRVAYFAHLEADDVTGPADGSRGRHGFTDVPQMLSADVGGGWPSAPVADMPRTVSGTVEWACGDDVAPTANALPTRTPPTPPPPTPTLGPVAAVVQVRVESTSVTGIPVEAHAGVVELEIVAQGPVVEYLAVDIVGPMSDGDVDLLRVGDLSWRDHYFGRGEGTIDFSYPMAMGPQSPFRTILNPGRYAFIAKRFVSGAERVESYALLTLVP
jgi:hypothetical protein